MAVLIFAILLIIGVFPALFFLDKLFQINFDRGADSVFWEPRGFVDKGDAKPKKAKRSLKDALAWITKTPEVAEDNLEAYRYLMFYRISLAFFSVCFAIGLAYFLMV